MKIWMELKYLWQLLIAASKLDVFDLAYEFSSEELNILSVAEGWWAKTNGFPRKGIGIRIGIFFWHFSTSLIAYCRGSDTVIPPGGFVFFALSKNEIDSLRPVYSQMPNAYLTGGNATPFPFPFVWAYALSCAYLPLVLFNFLKADGYRKRSFAYVFDHYWLIYGLYIAACMWLDRLRPKALVLANETYTYHRVMAKAASDKGILTVHMQHSTNPEKFPPLIHDYALLEGKDDLDKVVHRGTRRTRIFLIGMPKHDAHFQHINVQTQVRSMGVCTNVLDPLLRAEQLLARLLREGATLPLILRPHDGDCRVEEWRDMATRYGIEFSDSKTELSFDFLRKVDAIIAGESNILLEAALMNVIPLRYDFARSHLDWYGFNRSGLVEYFSEPDEICRCIQEISKSKPSVRMKAKWYCATVGTPYDGHSGELAASLIQSFASSTQVNGSIWKRIPGIGLEAYGLDDGGESTAMDRN